MRFREDGFMAVGSKVAVTLDLAFKWPSKADNYKVP
jgi:hypothetical protein